MKRRAPSLLSGRRVLLIDDDPSTARAITDACGAGVEVVEVSSAHLALKMLASGEPFDAILYELETPDATGGEFYERACRGDASLGRRIALLARAKATVHWAAVAPLGCPCVAKPVDASAVRAALEHVVRTDERLASELSATAFGLDADVLNVTTVPSDVDDAGGGTPFGPFYPAPLQGAVTHAERLARAISDALDTILESPAFDPNDPTDAEVWLVGRTEEVEAFVAEIVKDWRRGAVRLSDAAAVLERYIESMHSGMLTYLTHAGPLPCCGAVDLTTTSVIDHAAETHPLSPVNTDTPTPEHLRRTESGMSIDRIGRSPMTPPSSASSARSPDRTPGDFTVSPAPSAETTTATSAPTAPLAQLRAGLVDREGYVRLHVEAATARLHGMPRAEFETIRAALADHVATDPAFTSLLRQVEHA